LYTIFINAFYERSHFIDALSRASHRNRARTRVALLPHPHDVFVAREVVMFAMRPSAIAIAAPARVRGPSAKATRGTAPVRSASNASSKASLPRAGLTTRGCAMQVTSASALRVGSARGRTVVRRATPEASSDTSDAVEVPVEDPALAKAAAELAAALEQMATERESLTETTMEQRQREAKALESQEDLELVATKQAQLAATAWEEHAESEEAVARRSERSDAAFEAMGECEIVRQRRRACRAWRLVGRHTNLSLISKLALRCRPQALRSPVGQAGRALSNAEVPPRLWGNLRRLRQGFVVRPASSGHRCRVHDQCRDQSGWDIRWRACQIVPPPSAAHGLAT
jgi:hypothetical protein